MSTHQNPNKNPHQPYIISYLVLRRAVGILGFVLPIVLLVGFVLQNRGCSLPPSISHYYYTNMGTYFTGTLCAVALFLFSYNGPEKVDKRAALFASACSLCVAFLPTNNYTKWWDTCTSCINIDISSTRNILHYVSAGLLFATLAFFSLKLFTKTAPNVKPTPEKIIRNKIYKICGYTIIGCMAAIVILSIKPIETLPLIKKFSISTYVFEAIGLMAFGISWFIKGETLFKD